MSSRLLLGCVSMVAILLACCGSSTAQWEVALVNRTFNIGKLDFNINVDTQMDAFQYWCSRPGEWYMALRFSGRPPERDKYWINTGGYGDSCVLCGATYLLLNISRTTNTSLGQQLVPVWGGDCAPGRLHCSWAAQLMIDKTTYNTIFFTSRTPTAAQVVYPATISDICYPNPASPQQPTAKTTAPTATTPSSSVPHSQATALKPWWKFW